MRSSPLPLNSSLFATPVWPCVCGHKEARLSQWHQLGLGNTKIPNWFLDYKKCLSLTGPFCNAMAVAINHTRSAAAKTNGSGIGATLGATADVGAAYGIEAIIARKVSFT
jgi:hypothetical protein